MKKINTSFQAMLSSVPPSVQAEVDLEMGISNRLNDMMAAKGISKIELSRALGKRPSEVTKWLSGQHNFTLRTIALLSAYFGKSLITISS